MELYYGSGSDELVVPKDGEFSPSSDSCWFKWGKSAAHSFGSGNNYFVMGSDSTHDELNSNGKRCSYDVEMKGHSSDSRSVDDFLGIDGSFMSSLLDDVPITESFHKSVCISPGNPKSQESFMVDSQNSSKYARTDDMAFCCRSDHQSVTVPDFSFSEENGMDGYVDEETSIEEFVLQDLEIVMTQLTDKTRICFRDALYRLAKNSKQHMNETGDLLVDEAPPLTARDDETTRYSFSDDRSHEPMESESNTIDRAVANLMYSEMESNVSSIVFTAAPNLEQESYGTSHKDKTLSGDAQVPIHNVREHNTSCNASM